MIRLKSLLSEQLNTYTLYVDMGSSKTSGDVKIMVK